MGIEPERAEGSGGAFRSEHAQGTRRTADRVSDTRNSHHPKVVI